MDKYIKYKLEELIDDRDFVEWVMRPTQESNERWNQILSEHPEFYPKVKEASCIIKALMPVEEEISDERVDAIWNRLSDDMNKHRKITFRSIMKYAAILILLLGLGYVGFDQFRKYRIAKEFAMLDMTETGTVILADGSVHHFNSKQNTLQQLSSGELILNKDTLTENSEKTESKGLNQLLIPYGKRMRLTLSDGTHIWLNSGSKFLYPSHFTGKTREVYLAGEAFFDVAKNPKNPFHVNTPNIKVIVTGTKFDVSSYNDDKITRTVLAEGRVTVTKNQLFAKDVHLVPGEGAYYNKDHKDLNKGKADVSLTTSWIYGYLVFQGEPVSEVLKKISRYYNKTIITESDVQSISFSGKLDLKDNIDVVLQNVAFASALQVDNKNDKYYVKK